MVSCCVIELRFVTIITYFITQIVLDLTNKILFKLALCPHDMSPSLHSGKTKYYTVPDAILESTISPRISPWFLYIESGALGIY